MHLTLLALCLALITPTVAGAQVTIGGPSPKSTVIMQPDVQKELKLTKDQKKQIQDAMASMTPASMNADPTMMPDLSSINAQMDAKVTAGLSADQLARLNELWLQYNGPKVLVDANVATQLKLTDDQKTKIKAIWDQFGQEAMDGMVHARSQSAVNAIKKKRKDADVATLALLTPDQITAFTTMQGKPHKFMMPNDI